MAKRVVETTIDDLDNSITEDVITCSFGLGGTEYLIDLGPDNREELENFLARFIEVARPVRSGKSSRTTQARPARKVVDREKTHDVRQWAIDQGLTVSARGRISKEVQEAYEAAH